ncbi:DNA cytosine methyltransferase [Vibrio fluvialis]|uniref:Cytosine-specific methyltransferase n=1 Tax=Vibrio xiamenensis TaxID=861298 RepID=A0A1G8HTY9_9VIBR|nr:MULTISPECIES: DNA cytosine methyltransferase [Vibrio]EHH1246982.1 DNA cytosine methyltransferase [Vibrio parahaemolyticus]MCR9298838.1 DNA cytosine methyltransferase [Vibrio fluvialis]WHE20558.1 DNA cytosine methyltransferase [Vibrio vulnificus]SDI09940.1 DNA (cytosine-5)-methyltransferase 1 [Vibrio xiamenensis]HAS6206997.1 DNA (cytosine-5-)-methyltransferase [Vibrio vulnificus]
MSTKQRSDSSKGKYIDLFSGCGGLSLGLRNAGWQGVFAIEKDPMAFSTFKHNLIDNKDSHFDWPEWLPIEEATIQDVLEKHKKELVSLRGHVDLIAGGPPCQGFSLAGKRNEKDPRNKLSEEYIKMVEIVSPKFILLENVKGFDSSFKNSSKKPYSMVVKAKLEKLGYKVFHDYICSADFGVPQNRTRFIMIAVKRELISSKDFNPFSIISNTRRDFLLSKKLPLRHIKVSEAIGDLLVSTNGLAYHSGSESNGFKKIDYKKTRKQSSYLKVMRSGSDGRSPNSLRLARHRDTTIEKFKKIQKICKPGISLNDSMREQIGTKKQAITVLNANEPSKTLTTLPDDLLHYCEPRILTVREMARIQSFPDSFRIRGKYTTGGERRTMECPRYTQIGNAVPPLLAEALGITIRKLFDKG